MDEVNIIPPKLSPLPPLTGINKNLCSSTLFIFPAIYAYLFPSCRELMIGSLICLIISVLNHYHKAEILFISYLDRLIVNTIAGYFILNCIIKIGNTFYANIMYFFAVLTMAIYYYTSIYNAELYRDYHCLVHIFAITGIMFCIKANKTYLLAKVEESVPKVEESVPKVEESVPEVVESVPKADVLSL
jgi:hypothetical protein